MMSPPDQYDGRSVSQFLIIDDLTSPQAWACQRKLISHYTLRLCLLYILTGSVCVLESVNKNLQGAA